MKYFYDKNDVVIRNACYDDVHRMKDKLRASDRQEVLASHGHSPHEALTFSLESSPIVYTAVYKNEPVAIFGLVASPLNDGSATIWLLATDGFYPMRKTFLRLSKKFIAIFLKQFPVLYNLVDVNNQGTIRWLKWLGAKFVDPIPYGSAGMLFRPFTIEAKKELACV